MTNPLVVAVIPKDPSSPAPTPHRRQRPAGTSGASERRSRTISAVAAAPAHAVSASGITQDAEAVFAAATTAAMAPTCRATDQTSIGALRLARSSRSTRTTRTVTSAAVTTRLPQKIARQPMTLVARPPTIRPIAPASPPDALQIPRARSRAGPSSVARLRSTRALGTETAAASPWTTRPATRRVMDGASAARIEPTANSTSPAISAWRCP